WTSSRAQRRSAALDHRATGLKLPQGAGRRQARVGRPGAVAGAGSAGAGAVSGGEAGAGAAGAEAGVAAVAGAGAGLRPLHGLGGFGGWILLFTKTVKTPGASPKVALPQRLGVLSPSRRMRSTLKM